MSFYINTDQMDTEGEGLKYSEEQGDAKIGRHYPKLFKIGKIIQG